MIDSNELSIIRFIAPYHLYHLGVNMKKSLRLIVPLLTLLASPVLLNSAQATEIKGSPEELRKFLHPQKRSVSLSANVERRVYADQAIVSVIVKNEAKTLANAMQANATLRDKLKTALVEAGVASNDIQNSKFSSSPQYGWFGDKPKSFEVINRVAVKINNEQALQSLATIADKFEEMSIASTEYKHTTKDELYEEMKEEAMQKILASKSYYEKTLGVTLKTLSFYDSGIQSNATNGGHALEMIRVSGSRKAQDEYNMSSLAKPDYNSQQSSFEEIQYTSDMRVEFEIIDIDQ
jgi:uncharacterized protein YggE